MASVTEPPARPLAATRLLSRTALAEELGVEGVAALVAGGVERRLEPGGVLVRQGDVSGAVFVVLRGRLVASVAVGTEERDLDELGPGAVVGEVAMLTGEPRSATVRAAARSVVLELSPERMRAVLASNPRFAAAVAQRAGGRLRRAQLLHQIGALFGGIGVEALAAVEELIEWVTLRAGDELFAQGDSADAAYLVVTGRLAVVRGGPPDDDEVAELGAGDMVGEMALLEDAPRNASVYALRDTQLVKLQRQAYETLLDRHPGVGLVVARTVLRRSQAVVEHGTARPRSIVVVPAGDPRVADRLVDDLVTAIGPRARCVTSRDVDVALGVHGIAQAEDDDPGAIRLGHWLDEVQSGDDFVILRIDDGWTTWSRRALRYSDSVLLVADAAADPAPTPFEAELQRLLARHRHPRVSLALVHGPHVGSPVGTRRWLDARALASHHHVRAGDPVTTGRLARLLTGTATSLVLGGGGARGFAHLGVYEVLEREGVVVDMVGGTSIGAVMGMIIAMGNDAADARRVAVEGFRDLFDYTLPSVSLLRGRRITAKIRAALGDRDITDLWVPFFCASTNLTTAGVHFHDRGEAVRAVRASIAIPGVLPPVPMDGELLVDGGVLDNVPVEEMRRRNPTGRILAIDVAPADGPVAGTDYGLSVGGISAFRERRRGRSAPPSVLTTMVRSSLIASVRDRDRVVREGVADLYLDLDVEGGGMLDFSAAAAIADGGAASAGPVLRAWLADGSAVGRYAHAELPAPLPAAADEVAPRARRRRWRGTYGVLLLTVRDLQRRAMRFAAVIVGTAVVFTLLFLMTGLVEQFHREPRDTVAAFGATSWLVRAGSSGAFTSAATMPVGVADEVRGARATPVVLARYGIERDGEPTDVVVAGVPAGGIGTPKLTKGELPVGAEQLAIDDSAGLHVGDGVDLGGRRFTVTGLTDRTTMFAGMPLVFVDLPTAQELVYRGQPLATAVLIDGTPAAVPDGFSTLTPEQVATDGLRPLERSISSVNLIRVLLWFVAALIIGTMIYLSALERRRDVAVLTAVGASGGQMGASVALQGALTGLTAALAAAVLQRFAVPLFPLEVVVPGGALLQVPALAVVVSLVAGGIGLRAALRTDPALAFAGPGA